jgi:hypothetical protein
MIGRTVAVASKDLKRGDSGVTIANEILRQLECGHCVAISMHVEQDLCQPAPPCSHSSKYALHSCHVLHEARKPQKKRSFCALNTLPLNHLRSFRYSNMASQHTGVRQTPITYPNLPPQLDRKMQPQKDSLPLVEEVITPDPDDVLAKAELKREADRQIRFQNVANNMLGSPHGYLEVEILIIRWDESIDEFDGHTQEVYTRDAEYPDRQIFVANTYFYRSQGSRKSSRKATDTTVRLRGLQTTGILRSA